MCIRDSVEIERGNYVALFRIRTIGEQEEGLGDVDACVRYGQDILSGAELEVPPAAVGRFVRIPLAFHYDEGKLECRLNWRGFVHLLIDSVSLYRVEGAALKGFGRVAPALPSCGETGEPADARGPGLAADVAAVRAVLTASHAPTVVVAHSYGRIVTAEAPAGLDASLSGVAGLQLDMTDAENGLLNPLGINCLRTFPVHGRVVWGSRTMRGADAAADEYKYVPVRRLALFLEESLYRGTQWVVFEPNDEPLWAQIRLNLGAFMHNLFRQGAFQGTAPRDAYFVKCDKETTTQNDINLGIVNIVVGFAPLKPAEFVIIKLQQMAGQIAT